MNIGTSPFFDQIARLHELGFTGKEIGIGHLDTGVVPSQYLLVENIAANCRFDAEGQLVSNAEPMDSKNHGTHTAGIVCGNYSTEWGRGIAPDSRLYSVAVLGEGDTIVRILRGLEWLLTQPVRIICMPLGVPGNNPIFFPLIQALQQLDILCIAAIGNDKKGNSSSPGNYENVLSVGAVDHNDEPCAFTGSAYDEAGYCIRPDIMAPGKGIAAPTKNGNLLRFSGTSQATASISGLAALLLEVNPDLSAPQLKDILINAGTHSEPNHEAFSVGGTVHPVRAMGLAQQPDNMDFVMNPFGMPTEKYVDPGLEMRLKKFSGDLVRCAFIADNPAKVLDALERQLGEKPVAQSMIPVGNIGIVQASPRFIGELTRQEEVRVVSGSRIPNILEF